MKVKSLASDEFEIVAVLDGDICAAEDFILSGDKPTKAYREGLSQMLRIVAERGLENVPSAWLHEVDKPNKIYEFIKGPLRLFFFKGKDRQIAVCTTGTRKSGNKVDKGAVAKAAQARKQYLKAVEDNTLEVIESED